MKQVCFKKAILHWQEIQPLSDRDRERLSRRFTIDYNYNHIEDLDKKMHHHPINNTHAKPLPH